MLPVFLFIFIQLCFVAWIDIRTNKISNYWAIMNLACFPLLHFIDPVLFPVKFQTFLYSGVFLLFGFIFFLLKVMGAGDTKYLATFFLIIPAPFQKQVFEYLLVSTVLVGTFVLITNTAKNFDKIKIALQLQDIESLKSYFGTKFPYAPIILITWIWFGWTQRAAL